MQIGDVAKRTGFSRDTIRFYERVGVIGAKLLRGENKYRNYSDRDILRLLRVKKVKNYGFTLAEIRDILNAWETDAMRCNEMLRLANIKTREIERKIKDLQATKERIQAEFKSCALRCSDDKCGIL